MKLQIKNFILITMLALVTIGATTSCSSKKKLAKKEYEAKVEQAKSDLNAIIEGTTEWTLEEQKSRIEEIEKSDLQNQEVNDLIVKAKEVIESKIAEAERVAEQELAGTEVVSAENESTDAETENEEWEAITATETDLEVVDLDEEDKKANSKFAAFKEKLSAKKKHCSEWVDAHSKQIARIAGGSICVVALGLFLFYYVATSAGANKIANSGEEVYLLQHFEDNLQVLTLVEDEANEGYTLAFQEYTGANTQKVQILEVGDDLYQLVFVEGEYALEVTWDQATETYNLAVNPKSEDFTQWWLVEEADPAEMEHRFLCAYSVPLCYQTLEQGNGSSALAVQASTGGHETFVLERTVADGFTTEMVYQYGTEMKPTMLMETLLGYLGGFSAILFIAIVFMLCVNIYSRRLLGDKPAVLYAVVFAFMLAYASVWAVALFLVVYGLLCINAYLRKQEQQKPVAIKQYNESLPDTVKAELQESLDVMEKTLQEIKSYYV